MDEITPIIARKIIETVGGRGTPPEYGYLSFTAGLDPYLKIVGEEYLASFIKQGGSCFKMVVGTYGGGKTHFLYCLRDIAWKNNFVVSYVGLSPRESPFHQLDKVYQVLVKNMKAPLSPEELLSGKESGIVNFMRSWIGQKLQEYRSKGVTGEELSKKVHDEIEQIKGLESISFEKAVRNALAKLLDNKEDDFSTICQWLTGEGYDRKTHGHYGILQRIDKSTAFTMLRSFVQWLRKIGYSGLVILLDEGERVPSLSSKQKEEHMNNLRELIDECGHIEFQGVMMFYAVPDTTFLEGRTQIYQALNDRVRTIFDTVNPSGVQMELEKFISDPHSFLAEIGEKLRALYDKAYNCQLDNAQCQATIKIVAQAVYKRRSGDIGYKRLFVQKIIRAFHLLKQKKNTPTLKELDLA
jgi:hypothetical protein